MPKGRSQLNINIDPDLLAEIKSEAIKNGLTLTDYVTDKLKNASNKSIDKPESQSSSESIIALQDRLLKLEQFLNLKEGSQVTSPPQKGLDIIFTDEGAKHYSSVVKEEFYRCAQKKGLTPLAAWQEVAQHLKHYPESRPELVFGILMGGHELTGLQMTNAYQNGTCAMRYALNDWSNEPLERLDEAFLSAVKSKNLS